MWQYGIIDGDGTLLESKKVHRRIIRSISRLNNPDLLYMLSSCTVFQRLPLLKNYEKLAKRLDRLFFDLSDLTDRGKVKSYKGAREVVEQLVKKGMVLFASTVSRTQRTRERLRKLELLQFFRLVIGADIIPKEDHILWFARFLGISPKEFSEKCFWVGDTPHDIILAKSLGIYPIGITNTLEAEILKEAGAKEVIKYWEELPDLLKVLK